jgi:FkbM family methyltransferase
MLLIFIKILFKKTISYSQYLQDVFIDFVFLQNDRNGYFIDIGAYDGVTISNTYYFEKNKQWNGVAVEPNKIIFEKLKNNRNCNLVNGVVSDVDGQVQYMRVEGAGEMLSGIVNNFADKHKQRIDTSIATYGGNKHIEEVISYSIKNIIKQFQISSITILSIDTEGSELQILKTFPFETIKPKLILVENNFRSQEFSNFLTSKGYHYCFRLGDDIFYDRPITTYIKIKIWLFRFLKKTKRFKQSNGK